MIRRTLVTLVLAGAMASVVSCGKKGPPLAPLRPVPDAPASPTASRLGPDVHLRFVVPAQNIGLPGPVEIDRLEVFAVSLAAGAPAPPNRDFLTAKYRVGTIDIRQPEPPGQRAVDPALETRPAPGEPAAFVEPLTTEMLNPPPPPVIAPPIVPVVPPPAPAAAAKVPPPPTYATRIYAVRGVTSRGRPGNPSARVVVPLVEPPPPASEVSVDFTESAFVVSWMPPVAEADGPALLFNVYRAEAPATPITAKPAAAPSLDVPGMAFGVERCFSVRTVVQVAAVTIASEPSAPACVTPRDLFPPAAPAGLNAVASPGGISLIWDRNTEADLAGYLVLRAEAPGETLRPLTPEPILETSYRDTAATPGVRYVYAIVAVDNATPRNTSAESVRVEVTASQ